ncbi:hypothetical protein NL676_000405 [Syzygium grande]|nr:hypothetical protein NL676_000405 [Syzygium grande]
MLHLSDSNGSAIVVIVNDARIQQRRFDEVGTTARYRFGAPCGNAHVAAGALLADKVGETFDGKDHRFFEDSPDPIGLGGAMSVSRGSSIPAVELESFVYGGCA